MYLFTQSSWRLKILGLGNALFSIISLACANEVLDWAESQQIPNASMTDSPALAGFNGKLYLAYQGAGKSGQLWYTVSQDGNAWNQSKQIGNVAMSGSPSLAVLKDNLYLAYQGAGESGQLWYTVSQDGNAWNPSKQIGNVAMLGSPSLAVLNDKLYLAYHHKDSHGLKYTTIENGSHWGKHKTIRDIKLSRSPALVAFNDELYVVYQDNKRHGYLWYATTRDGESWTQPKLIPDARLSGSPALAVFDDKLYVAHQGMGQSGRLWYAATSDGENWAKGHQISGSNMWSMSCSPALASFGDKLCLSYGGALKNSKIWYTKACIKGFLRVSLKDFNFTFPNGGMEKYLQDKKQLIEMVSIQRLEVVDDALGVNISNIYERSIEETFSWELAQKLGTQVSAKVECGLVGFVKDETSVSASFEVSANQNWSTSRTRKFTVTAGMAPTAKGIYELGLRVYCVNNQELPFTATAKLTATPAIYGGKDAVHQTDRKLNAGIAAALFENSGGKMEEITERNEEKKYIKGIMKGKMKATYGVLEEVIARKIKPIN
ncbi:exo-alpha-sialidase [Candidatus Odyssella acanthamoebae]|uniref:Sialidase domain-containing protein n=1 Tax=Candidatus Odyssella acanthamoebae TaxID=91604 RepID=A0A077AZE1_9PROT|nr:exo-alpha-sialidase [Candidatus Paracaedibacter acanthamoebae]AIK96120.1 hypothetical protein ID47_04230 [Candidatus Paracaedibacter acanthamoebae]